MTGLAIPDANTLDQASDPAQYVELACQRAKEWLAIAIEHGEIEQIVELKSQAEAIRIYTQQKQLGKDAELSAAEIVRRAERGLGIAVKRGQENGQFRPPSQVTGRPRSADGTPLPSPTEIFDGHERADAYAMATSPDESFDAAIEEAKEEGNLSRANVVRKVAQKRIIDAPDKPKTNGKRHEILRKTRHIDSNRVVGETVAALDGLAMGVGLIEVAELDPERVEEWVTSLSNSLRSLNRLAKQLKEMTRV